MIRKISLFFLLSLLLATLCSCHRSAAEHQRSLGSSEDSKVTVGIVQKHIKVGMSQPDVAAALGSPNIVTRDNSGKETWIYDKMSNVESYSSSSGNFFVVRNAGAASSSQKTLTIIIKYDANSNVEKFSYHASSF